MHVISYLLERSWLLDLEYEECEICAIVHSSGLFSSSFFLLSDNDRNRVAHENSCDEFYFDIFKTIPSK